MSSVSGLFRNSFWETDFLSQNGFETVINHMKEGNRSCRWLEDYLKGRAKAEEEYSKALLKISRLERGASECTTMRKALDEFRTEAETEATLHATLAQRIGEEMAKLTEFREKQRDERKRNEDTVHRAHKNKTELYKKMLSCKNNYESKCKAADKAESDAEKIKFGNKHKDAEKAKKSALQARSTAMKADEDYKQSVGAVEGARQTWVKDHSDACDVLQRLEEERIQFLRNVIWVYSNICSDLCVRLDESREKIRQVTENCDHAADIREFVAQKSTCIAPLQTIEYVSFGNHEPTVSTPPTGALPDIPMSKPLTNGGHSHIYEMEGDGGSAAPSSGGYQVLFDYTPQSQDELELQVGDVVQKEPGNADMGWMYGLNTRTRQKGLVPCNYVKAL